MMLGTRLNLGYKWDYKVYSNWTPKCVTREMVSIEFLWLVDLSVPLPQFSHRSGES